MYRKIFEHSISVLCSGSYWSTLCFMFFSLIFDGLHNDIQIFLLRCLYCKLLKKFWLQSEHEPTIKVEHHQPVEFNNLMSHSNFGPDEVSTHFKINLIGEPFTHLCLVSLVSNLCAYTLLTGWIMCLQSQKIWCTDKTCFANPVTNIG